MGPGARGALVYRSNGGKCERRGLNMCKGLRG